MTPPESIEAPAYMDFVPTFRFFRSVLIVLLLIGGLSSAVAEEPVDYEKQVKALFKERCFACHGALKQEADLRLDTGKFIRQGGYSGEAVTPLQPDESLLIEKVTSEDDADRMPPEGKPLTAEEIETLKRWITEGAKSSDDELPEVDPREHWAFQLPQRPPLSEATTGAHHNPIDVFVAEQLAQRGLQAQPRAAKHVLLRRVSLDLTGLPPTREELLAFLADDAPDAYQRAVDRLLNSPRYGERWARHWMDVWRYSDWYGRRYVPDVWNSAPQIWRWRDWIVRSLNEDKGYDRMLSEMLAADEICPEDSEAAVATGYLIRNWYALNPNDWMRNTVEHTGKAFLGLTFNCAHCHDHKYDPISQDNYFQLRAYFEPMYLRQDRRPGEADPGPFQDYEYGKLRKIQHLGTIRIFDKTPDAPTWFYTGGDERNRVTERGSIPPAVPEFLTAAQPTIEPIKLPPRAWYPSLNPKIQETVLADLRDKVQAAEAKLSELKQNPGEIPAAASEQLAKAEAAYQHALQAAEDSDRLKALAGEQSLMFDATTGRRIVHHRLPDLKELPDGVTIDFQLRLATDAHFNFQLAKDVDKGLTAGFVAFEKGSILAYQPGTFTEFEAGRYDFAAEQDRFQVQLKLETAADRCLLTVRSMTDEKVLVDEVPVSLNGWNPVGDNSKGISFDARTGSVAAVDEVRLFLPPSETTETNEPTVFAKFDFEAPAYPRGGDVVGVGGWEASSFCAAPATSVLATSLKGPELAQLKQQWEVAQRVAELPQLKIAAAEADLTAARAELADAEARILADRAKYGEAVDVDTNETAHAAVQSQHEMELRAQEAVVLSKRVALATAEAKPESDEKRAKEIETAQQQLTEAEGALAKLNSGTEEKTESTDHPPLGPTYPKTSTGRRRALAAWITGRQNPLTARVAVNHIWMRHFHAPLVASVYDFGRNGSPPTHPRLLDWLAVELMESNWSMKHLHRLIVTSETYCRTTTTGEFTENQKLDPENRWLWRMNSGRMEAELVRDSLLHCGTMLDFTQGGKPLENKEALTTYRRSLYYEVYPEEGGANPLAALFDAPDPLDCYRRTRSIVPQQALALTNSELVHNVSQKIVADWKPSAGQTEELETDFIIQMFEKILCRAPTEAEQQLCRDSLKRQFELLQKANDPEPLLRARESLVRALLNHNDFVTIR